MRCNAIALLVTTLWCFAHLSASAYGPILRLSGSAPRAPPCCCRATARRCGRPTSRSPGRTRRCWPGVWVSHQATLPGSNAHSLQPTVLVVAPSGNGIVELELRSKCLATLWC